MLSYFFRGSGYLIFWLGYGAYALAFVLVLPALILASCGHQLDRMAMALWDRQDFRGPNPRGWRWSGLFN